VNITETQNFLDAIKGRLDGISGQCEDGIFKLPSEDARRHITAVSGMQYDLKQRSIVIERERKLLQEQLQLVTHLHDTCKQTILDGQTLYEGLMENQTPV